MDPILAAGGTIAAKKIFGNLVNDLYKSFTRLTGRKIKQWNTKRKIETLYRRIHIIRKVKTIWQVDKAVDLTTFYCDSHVLVDNVRKKIDRLNELPEDRNILIEGIAGQGKSIFLRYLCAVELEYACNIPIFIELRRIGPNKSLRDRIFAGFNALGLTLDDELFDALAVSGKIILFLDAFDEISEDLKMSVLTDIEDLASSYDDKLRIIVTARPHQQIKNSNYFRVATLDDLRENEYAIVIEKLSQKAKWAQALVDHIEERAIHIKDLLCTPLMVTLLVILYKSYNKLPDNLPEFYDNLFYTLLQRHDGTKPGFVRSRRCDLDDAQYRQVFESLCILTKKHPKREYSYETIYKLVKNTLDQNDFVVDANSYIDDIVKITCLILKEGQVYRFIHNTVQEYYASAYVAGKPESWAQQFYTKIFSRQAHQQWSQELSFLSEIDNFRFNRYYRLPGILNFFRMSEGELLSESKHNILNTLEEYLKKILIRRVNKTVQHVYWGAGDFMYQEFAQTLTILTKDFNISCPIVYKKGLKISSTHVKKRLIEIKNSDKDYYDSSLTSGSGNIYSAFDVFNTFRNHEEIFQNIKRFYLDLVAEAKSIVISLEQAEDSSLLDGLV